MAYRLRWGAEIDLNGAGWWRGNTRDSIDRPPVFATAKFWNRQARRCGPAAGARTQIKGDTYEQTVVARFGVVIVGLEANARNVVMPLGRPLLGATRPEQIKGDILLCLDPTQVRRPLGSALATVVLHDAGC